jgi:hypothetical protein
VAAYVWAAALIQSILQRKAFAWSGRGTGSLLRAHLENRGVESALLRSMDGRGGSCWYWSLNRRSRRGNSSSAGSSEVKAHLGHAVARRKENRFGGAS